MMQTNVKSIRQTLFLLDLMGHMVEFAVIQSSHLDYWSNMGLVKRIVVDSITFLHRFLELSTCYSINNHTVTKCDLSNNSSCKAIVCATSIRQELSYCRDYILIGNFLFMVFLPLLLLSILNGHIYRVLSQSTKRSSLSSKTGRSKRDQSIATILISIVFLFGICNIPRVSLNLFEVRSIILYTQEVDVVKEDYIT